MLFFKSIYFRSRFYVFGLSIVAMFVIAAFWQPMHYVAKLALLVYGVFIFLDFILLYSIRNGLSASRNTANRFSNGDQNNISISVSNHYSFKLKIRLIDELPPQFQIRDFVFNTQMKSGEDKVFSYNLRPVVRGIYKFGGINIFVKSMISMMERRYIIDQAMEVAVYPSFHRLKEIELLSFAEMRNLLGLKKIRHIGYNKEFEQVKNYVIGDEIKHINWKATARKNQLMVNQFQDEKSQNVYCMIDMGRSMKMPFNGMSLLDYSINAALALSQIILKNTDRVGLITYNRKIHSVIPAEKRNNQLNLMLETLYKQETKFAESSFDRVYSFVKNRVHQRSLLIFFINFESIYSLKRQLSLFLQLNKNHLVLLISYKNTEIEDIAKSKAGSLDDVYLKTIAENFNFEKRMFLKELSRHGIQTLFTAPENLTINTVNKYLEIKARGLL